MLSLFERKQSDPWFKVSNFIIFDYQKNCLFHWRSQRRTAFQLFYFLFFKYSILFFSHTTPCHFFPPTRFPSWQTEEGKFSLPHDRLFRPQFVFFDHLPLGQESFSLFLLALLTSSDLFLSLSSLPKILALCLGFFSPSKSRKDENSNLVQLFSLQSLNPKPILPHASFNPLIASTQTGLSPLRQPHQRPQSRAPFSDLGTFFEKPRGIKSKRKCAPGWNHYYTLACFYVYLWSLRWGSKIQIKYRVRKYDLDCDNKKGSD